MSFKERRQRKKAKMNILNIEHVSKIFGDKRFLMMSLMEYRKGIRLESLV